MKRILSIIIFLVSCVLFLNLGKNYIDDLEQKAINDAINSDKYTVEEYANFQQELNNKTFYYYNHLSDEQKDDYITLYFAVLNFDKSCKVEVSEDELKTILFAIIYDNSNIFWLSGDYTYYVHSEYIELVPEYSYTKEDANTISVNLQNRINKIISGIPAYSNDFEKELYLHDYICDNTVYDDATYLNGGDTAHSSLLEGKSICEGYARAMQILLDAVGIENYLVVGDGTSEGVTEPHMWNIVNIDGQNYHLDVTWNDSVTRNADGYFYFNVTDDYILRDHSNLAPQNNNCVYNFANYYVVNNTYVEMFTGFDSLVSPTAQALKNGELTVSFVFKNDSDFKRAIDMTNDNATLFDYVHKSVEKSGRNLSVTNVAFSTIEDYNYLCIEFKKE